MKKHGVEILCIGTELLLGDILNSNARWIAKELAILGLPHYLQTVVGDNIARLQRAVLEAAKRSKILITTGGLGPTPDDLTTEALAAAFNMPLEEKTELWIDIQNKMSVNSQISSLSNRKQALLPFNAKVIPNRSGTAPGMIWHPKEDFTILTFPGVPSELKEMWTETAVPWLKQHGGATDTLISKVLKFSGISESTLSDEVADLLNNNNPTLAPYASLGEVKLRLTAKGKNIEEAQKLLLPLEQELRNRVGVKCYGSGNESLASVVLELLRQRNETLAIAESCTGGGLGAAISALPGASDVFVGGVIAYSNAIKEKLLGVPKELIDNHGAVSEEVVRAMAKGARKKLNSDWGIAISGLAGPAGGTKDKPVGTVHIAVAGPRSCESNPQNFGANRGRIGIQRLSVLNGLEQLRLLLLSQS
nr:competence/damage-inducible protein A [Prochlorococcus sp. MIT 1307]